MAYEQKPGDIAVFRETDKRNERGPDWRGTMVIPDGAKPGDKMEVAMWEKGDRGTMLAGSVKAPRQRDDSFPSRREGGVAGRGDFGGGQDTRRGDFDPDDAPF